MSFKDLKKSSTTNLASLTQEIDKLNAKKSFEKDVRYWTPTRDKAGNGSAVIRFLPAIEGESVPFVRLWHHSFQGPGGWYIENSRSTLSGEADPMFEYNGQLYNSGIEANKKLVSEKTKRKLAYISNIYVVKDPGNPENEGKNFLFRYGKKIFDKLNDAMIGDPEDDEVVKFNPFDLWTGANFKLKVAKVEGFPNYDKSSFASVGALADSDAELERIYNAAYSLTAEVAIDKFKSYDDLKARMCLALKIGDKATKPVAKAAKEDEAPWASPETAEEESDLSFFNKLAEEE